jgi:hypothetical protein
VPLRCSLAAIVSGWLLYWYTWSTYKSLHPPDYADNNEETPATAHAALTAAPRLAASRVPSARRTANTWRAHRLRLSCTRLLRCERQFGPWHCRGMKLLVGRATSHTVFLEALKKRTCREIVAIVAERQRDHVADEQHAVEQQLRVPTRGSDKRSGVARSARGAGRLAMWRSRSRSEVATRLPNGGSARRARTGMKQMRIIRTKMSGAKIGTPSPLFTKSWMVCPRCMPQ